MLKKLLKYDLRELARSSFPMFISALVISVVCCGLLFFTFSFAEEDNLFAAMGFSVGFYGLGIFAIVVMTAVVELLCLARYYKSLFTDEGYLNMVIPVETKTLLNAKILAVLIWDAVVFGVMLISLLIGVLLPILLYNTSYITDIVEFFSYAFPEEFSFSLVVILTVIQLLATFIEGTLAILTAITVGSVMIRKHKILGSIIFYFVISFVQSMVELILGGGLELLAIAIFGETSIAVIVTPIIASTLLALGLAVLMYCINHHVLKNKFNIE